MCFSEENAQLEGGLCVNMDAMTNEGRDQTEGMEPRDDQALWALLGQRRPTVEVSPYFARRVLREVALAEETRTVGWWGRLRGGWSRGTFARRAALGSGLLSGACATLLLVVAHSGQTPQAASVAVVRETVAIQTAADVPTVAAEARSMDVGPQTKGQVQDVEVIADLDNALQREESRLWAEDSARF